MKRTKSAGVPCGEWPVMPASANSAAVMYSGGRAQMSRTAGSSLWRGSTPGSSWDAGADSAGE
eukprot:2923535-Prymnesium_polylepis.1